MKKMLVYIAFPQYKHLLLQELKNIDTADENLIFSSDHIQPCFAQDIWFNPKKIQFDSINEAAKILLQHQPHWYPYPHKFIRRSTLIATKLKNPFAKKLKFPCKTNLPDTGVFCLLDNNTLLYSTERWKKFPFGTVTFQEDKENPPNRAYLKLWEAFCFLNRFPKPGETALDLGASPGGWSYVLASLGAKVIAVDKAPLASSLQDHPAIQFMQQSAFSLDPRKISPVDWLCADIACYPTRLYQFLKQWIDANVASNIICTLKLQGETDLEIIKQFQSIPNSRVIHLFYNKHEATFMCPLNL